MGVVKETFVVAVLWYYTDVIELFVDAVLFLHDAICVACGGSLLSKSLETIGC